MARPTFDVRRGRLERQWDGSCPPDTELQRNTLLPHLPKVLDKGMFSWLIDREPVQSNRGTVPLATCVEEAAWLVGYTGYGNILRQVYAHLLYTRGALGSYLLSYDQECRPEVVLIVTPYAVNVEAERWFKLDIAYQRAFFIEPNWDKVRFLDDAYYMFTIDFPSYKQSVWAYLQLAPRAERWRTTVMMLLFLHHYRRGHSLFSWPADLPPPPPLVPATLVHRLEGTHHTLLPPQNPTPGFDRQWQPPTIPGVQPPHPAQSWVFCVKPATPDPVLTHLERDREGHFIRYPTGPIITGPQTQLPQRPARTRHPSSNMLTNGERPAVEDHVPNQDSEGSMTGQDSNITRPAAQ